MVSHLGSHKHERPHITCRFRKGMIASDSSAVFPCKSSRIRACWHNPPVLAPPVLACQEFFRKLTPQIVQKTLAWSMSQRLLERMESIVHMRDHLGLPIFHLDSCPTIFIAKTLPDPSKFISNWGDPTKWWYHSSLPWGAQHAVGSSTPSSWTRAATGQSCCRMPPGPPSNTATWCIFRVIWWNLAWETPP